MRWRVVAVLWAGRAALAQMKSRMRVKMEAMAFEVEVEAVMQTMEQTCLILHFINSI